MKKVISLSLCIIMLLSVFSICVNGAVINIASTSYEATDERCIPLKDAIKAYESEHNTKIETYRNYFYIPDGSEHFVDDESRTLPNWFNEYFSKICIWYNQDMCTNSPCPDFYCGYSIEKTYIKNLYYADIPVGVNMFLINNGMSSENKPTYSRCESMLLGPECNEFNGTEYINCDNMIFVFDKMDWYSCVDTAMMHGEWYYYRGNNGCYSKTSDGDCLNPTHDHKTLKESVTEYEAKTGEKLKTNRYYFLMPNGENGEPCLDDNLPESYLQYAKSWYSEYSSEPYLYWWGADEFNPDIFPGYKIEKSDADCVYYADVPEFVKTLVWNNGISGFDVHNKLSEYQAQTINVPCEYYDAGESPYYPNGTESFDNMIYVLSPLTVHVGMDEDYLFPGEWFYYYGDGCYGTVKNGTSSDCIRFDHNHSISYTEKFKNYLLSTGYTEEQLQEGFWSSSPLYIYDDPYLDNPNFYLALVKGGLNDYLDTSVYGVFGDYFLQSGELKPHKLGYYVYVSLEDKFYTLSEAWDLKINGIEEIFSEYFVKEGHAYVIGDQDQDGELSILDATAIQLTLVSTKDFSSSEIKYSTCVYGDELKNLSDADHDGDVSILDATQIQLKLAGLK